MNEDFVTFNQAKTLKELGFNWTSYNYYDNDGSFITTSHDEYYSEFEGRTTAPTLAQAQKWLREKGLIININYEPVYYYGDIYNEKKGDYEYMITENFETYESVLSVMIDKALEIID